MSRRENNLSIHHILPKSRDWSGDRINLEVMKDSTHRAIHTLFQNQMIAEQLITTVSLSDKALREDVRDWLLDILTRRDIDDPYAWYKPKAIK